MATKISVGGTTATIDDMKWASPDRNIAQMLNRMTRAYNNGESSPSDPFPEYHEAKRIIKLLDHGHIIALGKMPEYVANRVY